MKSPLSTVIFHIVMHDPVAIRFPDIAIVESIRMSKVVTIVMALAGLMEVVYDSEGQRVRSSESQSDEDINYVLRIPSVQAFWHPCAVTVGFSDSPTVKMFDPLRVVAASDDVGISWAFLAVEVLAGSA